MKNKVLVAVDESSNAMKAVEYVARVLGKGVQVTLYHVFPKAPTKGIENEKVLVGHRLPFKESVDHFRALLEHKRAGMEEVMNKAKKVLVKAGIHEKNVRIKIQEGKKGVARDILSELRTGKYDTLVVGRRGLTGAKAFFSGSVSGKIFQGAKNCAVWIVE